MKAIYSDQVDLTATQGFLRFIAEVGEVEAIQYLKSILDASEEGVVNTLFRDEETNVEQSWAQFALYNNFPKLWVFVRDNTKFDIEIFVLELDYKMLVLMSEIDSETPYNMARLIDSPVLWNLVFENEGIENINFLEENYYSPSKDFALAMLESWKLFVLNNSSKSLTSENKHFVYFTLYADLLSFHDDGDNTEQYDLLLVAYKELWDLLRENDLGTNSIGKNALESILMRSISLQDHAMLNDILEHSKGDKDFLLEIIDSKQNIIAYKDEVIVFFELHPLYYAYERKASAEIRKSTDEDGNRISLYEVHQNIKENFEILFRLLDYGANINFSTENHSLGNLSATLGDLELLKKLIEYGYDINYVGPNDYNVIETAIFNDQSEIFEYLFENHYYFGQNEVDALAYYVLSHGSSSCLEYLNQKVGGNYPFYLDFFVGENLFSIHDFVLKNETVMEEFFPGYNEMITKRNDDSQLHFAALAIWLIDSFYGELMPLFEVMDGWKNSNKNIDGAPRFSMANTKITIEQAMHIISDYKDQIIIKCCYDYDFFHSFLQQTYGLKFEDYITAAIEDIKFEVLTALDSTVTRQLIEGNILLANSLIENELLIAQNQQDISKLQKQNQQMFSLIKRMADASGLELPEDMMVEIVGSDIEG